MERQEAKNIQEEITKELNVLLKKYNFEVENMGITYTQDNSKLSFNIHCKNSNKSFMDKVKKEEFKRLCKFYGFKESDYKVKFYDGKEEFMLVGFNTNARKNPCLLIRTRDDKEFVAPTSYVLPKLKTND